MKKIINQEDMRNANLMDVFSIIRNKKTLTRKEIQNLTGFSWGGVSQVVSRLIEDGYIVEKKGAKLGSSGRTPLYLEVNAFNNYVVGIDINESGVYAEVLNLNDDVLYSKAGVTDFTDKNSLLDSIYAVLDDVFGKYANYDIFAMGVSIQGMVDVKNGVSVWLNDCKGWDNVPIARLLGDRYSAPVYIAHDPDCILYAGAREDRLTDDMMLIRLCDGIGMAVMKNRELISGFGMMEIGHTIVDRGDGKRSSLESYISIKNIEKLKNTPEIDEYIKEITNIFVTTVANSMILFNVNKLLICGELMQYNYLNFDEIVAGIKDVLCDDSVVIIEYSEKKAARGAALIAVNEKMNYLQ